MESYHKELVEVVNDKRYRLSRECSTLQSNKDSFQQGWREAEKHSQEKIDKLKDILKGLIEFNQVRDNCWADRVIKEMGE